MTFRPRKDPFASSQNGNAYNGANEGKDAEGTIYGQQIKKEAGSANTTIGINIQNPHWFSWMQPSGTTYGYCPNKTPYYNSWSANNTALQTANPTVDNIVVKTIYDPCPVGYTVTPANAFSKFTTKNWDSTNKGHTLGGCWFPSGGGRNPSVGNLVVVGTDGYYWQVVPIKTADARNLNITINSASPTNGNNRSCGMFIRPVAEKD